MPPSLGKVLARLMRTLHTVLLAAALALTVQATARAVTFTATLGSIKITARPGQALTREFRLTLDADQPKTRFNSHMQDWWRNEDGTQSFYRDPGTLAHSCGRWVTLNPVEVEVQPGGTLFTRLTVTVSPEAKPGGYWCVLTVDELPDPLATSEGVGIRFMASVSIGVFVSVDQLFGSYPSFAIRGSNTVALSTGKRSTLARYAAKLMALFLLASLCLE